MRTNSLERWLWQMVWRCLWAYLSRRLVRVRIQAGFPPTRLYGERNAVILSDLERLEEQLRHYILHA